MNRALSANAELSFEITPDLSFDPETSAILDDTEKLLQIRKANINFHEEEKKKGGKAVRSSPRIARKLRFQQNDDGEEEDVDMDTT